MFALRKICHPSHRLLLRKMEKVLRGISNTARLDGGKDCQQLPLTRLARRGRPRVLRIASNLMQNGVLSVLAEGTPRLLTPRCALNKEKQRPISLRKAAAGGVQKGILSFVRAEQVSCLFLSGSPWGPGPRPRRTLGTFLLWKVPRRRHDKPSSVAKLSHQSIRL